MLAALRTRSQIVLRSGSAAAGATASITASTASITASGTTGTGISPPPSSPIQLDPQEDQLCRLLINVTRHLSATRPDLPPVTLRIAGGWVRDRV